MISLLKFGEKFKKVEITFYVNATTTKTNGHFSLLCLFKYLKIIAKLPNHD